jgi:EAL and modified HD-GYP domain-containing signal transduction protein
MEILVKEWGPGPQDQDYSESAFMTGVLSLVDVLLGTPMEKILAQLNLAEEVRLALLERKGALGSLLLLTEKLENLDFAEVSQLLNQYHCSREILITAQLEAIEWTNSLDEAF